MFHAASSYLSLYLYVRSLNRYSLPYFLFKLRRKPYFTVILKKLFICIFVSYGSGELMELIIQRNILKYLKKVSELSKGINKPTTTAIN
jgi:hypothetical protein